jgi:hypothetical protein
VAPEPEAPAELEAPVQAARAAPARVAQVVVVPVAGPAVVVPAVAAEATDRS